jgi:hypothetical protein
MCLQWVDCPAKPAKSEPNNIMLDTLNSLLVADLMRGPDTSRVLSVMFIELPRNALYETQHPCRFEDNRLNMAQKGHSSVQNDCNVLNLLDMFKFMTPNAVVKPNGFLISIKRNRLAFCSVQAELPSRAPLLQAVQITQNPVAIVNTFNGGNMLKNLKHFVCIINEEQIPYPEWQ